MAANDVTVVRDRWGIGHATAKDADSAFWAQGWLAASDRMWQMEWDRRRAFGRWAEVAGPPAIGEDRFFRRLNLAEVAKADFQALDSRTRAMTEAYARGVNAWLDGNADQLPPEFAHHPAPPERWEAWHSLAVYKVRHLFMGTLHRKLWRGAVAVAAGPEVARIMVGDPGAASAIVPGTGAPLDLLVDAADILQRASSDLAAIPDVDGASNSWALDGSRTASGKPLLAGDPHRGIEFPNVYYQCHLSCDSFDVIGMAFPGVPGFPHFGHNDRVAWCITHGMADDTDVFVAEGPLTVDRTETIDVLGAASVEVDCATTDAGPVILGEPGRDPAVLAMMWTGMHGIDRTFDCLAPMITAGSVDELEDAVADWVIPVNSLLSADVDGNISFKIRGSVVERPAASRWTPVPGDSHHAWTGLESVAAERLHHWRNPDRGYLVTANNRISDDGPFISLDFAGPARHDRIVQLLDGISDATVADMTAVHADTVSLVAPRLIERLRSVRPSTEAGRAALDELRFWDGNLDATSCAATVYSVLRRHWAVEVGRRLGVSRPALGGAGWPAAVYASRMLFDAAGTLLRTGGWKSIPGLETDEDVDQLLGELVDRVVADLTETLGPDRSTWQWERVHQMASPHPLASARPELGELHPPVDGCPGDGDTVRCAGLMPRTGDRVASSSVARYVFDLDDWDRSGWVVPHGVSGVRGSGHDLDQRAAWLACELLPMAYTAQAVADVAVSTDSLRVTGAD